jgi:hypothetical protein
MGLLVGVVLLLAIVRLAVFFGLPGRGILALVMSFAFLGYLIRIVRIHDKTRGLYWVYQGIEAPFVVILGIGIVYFVLYSLSVLP